MALPLIGCRSARSTPVDLNVASARELSFRGIDAMQQGDWDKAEQLLGKAVQTCATDVRSHRNYAEALWQRGAAESAIEHMEEAVRLSNGEPELLVRLGEMHLASGRLDAAAQQADLAIRRNRHLASAWALQGDVEFRRGRQEEALASYHRALGYEEHYPEVQMAVARVYQQSKRPHRMLATLESLEDQFPADQVPQDVYFMQGIALKQLGRYDQAIQTLAKAENAGRPTADMLFHIGEAYLLAGDHSNARLSVVTALSLDASHPASRQLQSRLENGSGDLSVALDRARGR